MKRKLPVGELTLGMYVAELDRPWLDSPFPFQGFLIESNDQLAALREVCRYVYVDEERSLEAASGGAAAAAPEAGVPTPDTLAGTTTTVTDSDDTTGAGWRGRSLFRHDLRQFIQTREQLHQHVLKLLEDVRLGRSVDIRNTRALVEEVMQIVTEDPTTALWLKNLESKHEHTAAHSFNTCVFALVFGAHLGLERELLESLGLGALLHDVGKMRTPVSVLDKPGLLTEDEFDIMKKHPLDGFNILRKHKDVPEKTLEIVQLHHERVSGQGYPFGLKGDEIPVHVRIAAIADVYDDITSNRVYHEGIAAHTGLNMMFHWAPRDFGEDMMQEFIRCIGIYPIGSLVQLTNGALGIVMSTNPASRLRPIVMLVRDPEGHPYERRPLVNLAMGTDKNDGAGLAIQRVVDSKDSGIDVGRIAKLEAGLRG